MLPVTPPAVTYNSTIKMRSPGSLLRPGPPPPPHARDVSSLHPVFFTERLQRTPFPMAASSPSTQPPRGSVGGGSGGAMFTNPVAHGYMYHETRRRAEGSSVPRL
ncbi:hypothetical protein Micbo1qcDRAFT_237451 [Microdochium bolleyi]|uniref:Uncharacterized protein n=1 Tax=Microdochium bolleyi TaxID=196109 RepID=A0A136IKS0_9PEZI|nr:hypothetical protein Micbo1qcDRAFT_237451 [Microdochium bolleyi]